MDIRELLITHNSELENFMNSNQYKLSKTILKIRYKLSYSPNDVAEILDVSFNDYIKLESGDLTTSVERYNEIVNTLLDYLNKKMELKLRNTVQHVFDFNLMKSKGTYSSEGDSYQTNTRGYSQFSLKLDEVA